MTLLMTGGTGFLGLSLLRRHLLAGRRVVLLAHAGSAPALERVERFLVASGQIDQLPTPLERLLTVVDSDVTVPGLGLSPTELRRLARDADELWHVAASVVLDGRDEQVWRSNVTGTEHVLRLAGHLPRHAPLRHVSTAFVAGRIRHGDVREDDSARTTEFENTYERSKHAAEELVRRWAGTHGRSVLILRPSILVPGGPPVDGLPEHTLGRVSRIVAQVADRVGTVETRLVLRVGADPRAQLNLLPVDWAAQAMHLLAGRVPAGVHTVHVVHPGDVPVRTIAAALEDAAPVRLRMMPAPPAEPTPTERWVYRRAAGFLPYLYHRRRFDAAAAAALLPDLAPPPAVDREHLRHCLRPAVAVRGTARLGKPA